MCFTTGGQQPAKPLLQAAKNIRKTLSSYATIRKPDFNGYPLMLIGYMRVYAALTPLIWEHVNSYGRFDLDMNARLALL